MDSNESLPGVAVADNFNREMVVRESEPEARIIQRDIVLTARDRVERPRTTNEDTKTVFRNDSNANKNERTRQGVSRLLKGQRQRKRASSHHG